MMNQPDFYRSDLVGELYPPRVQEAMLEGLSTQVEEAGRDERKTLLLLVDPQVDFIHVDGSLSVPGAVEDTRRTIEWIFSNLGKITNVAVSLDTHYLQQIFYQTWWANADGGSPQPFTTITADDIEKGLWSPVEQPTWSREYVKVLHERAQKELMIWPYHTMLGTPGHSITPALYEVLIYFTAVRKTDLRLIRKGTLPQTEYYSLFEPEVKVPDDPAGGLNQEFLDWVLSFDAIYFAGQAKSHCVLESVGSIVKRFGDQPEVMAKIHLLTDCMSSVGHPEIDFEALAVEAFNQFAQRGLKLLKSSDPIDD
jgi:nicotinamidase/pyrazinamidase